MSEELKPVAYLTEVHSANGVELLIAPTEEECDAQSTKACIDDPGGVTVSSPVFGLSFVLALQSRIAELSKPLTEEDVRKAGGIISYLGVTFDSLDQLNAAIAAKEPRNG